MAPAFLQWPGRCRSCHLTHWRPRRLKTMSQTKMIQIEHSQWIIFGDWRFTIIHKKIHEEHWHWRFNMLFFFHEFDDWNMDLSYESKNWGMNRHNSYARLNDVFFVKFHMAQRPKHHRIIPTYSNNPSASDSSSARTQSSYLTSYQNGEVSQPRERIETHMRQTTSVSVNERNHTWPHDSKLRRPN